MERLTFEGLFCDIAQCGETPGGSFCENGMCSQRETWERLKAYEDTGLTPEEVDFANEAAQQLEGLCKLCDLDRLEELAQAGKDGRVLVLPCKVGDTVYEVQTIRKRIQPLEIISVCIGRMGEPFFYWELKDGLGIYQNVRGFGFSQLGKTVFLSRKEAERALEEGKGDGCIH